ncbi:hypothetical protein HYC85_030612, partial [Camellia sinensis]
TTLSKTYLSSFSVSSPLLFSIFPLLSNHSSLSSPLSSLSLSLCLPSPLKPVVPLTTPSLSLSSTQPVVPRLKPVVPCPPSSKRLTLISLSHSIPCPPVVSFPLSLPLRSHDGFKPNLQKTQASPEGSSNNTIVGMFAKIFLIIYFDFWFNFCSSIYFILIFKELKPILIWFIVIISI